MPDMMRNKLGAYLDGELDRSGQMEMQAHLENCPACRDELEALRRLSHLLRAAPQPEHTSPHHFKAQLMQQLPNRAEGRQPNPKNAWLPWLAPAFVLAGWIFIQVTIGLSSLVSIAHRAGILDGAATWLTSSSQQMQWFSITQSTLGGMLNPGWQTGLQVLNDAGLLVQNLLVIFLVQVGVAVLYWVTLTLVWQKKVKPTWAVSPAPHLFEG